MARWYNTISRQIKLCVMMSQETAKDIQHIHIVSINLIMTRRQCWWIRFQRKTQVATLHTVRIWLKYIRQIWEKYEEDVAQVLAKVSNYVIRGNNFRLEKTRSKYDVRKFGFASMIVSLWNSLPNRVIFSNTTNTILKIDLIGFGKILKHC